MADMSHSKLLLAILPYINVYVITKSDDATHEGAVENTEWKKILAEQTQQA